MTKEHPMQVVYQCDGYRNDQGMFYADTGVQVLGFDSEERLATFVLSMKPFLTEAVNKALAVAYGDGQIIHGKEHYERSSNVQ